MCASGGDHPCPKPSGCVFHTASCVFGLPGTRRAAGTSRGEAAKEGAAPAAGRRAARGRCGVHGTQGQEQRAIQAVVHVLFVVLLRWVTGAVLQRGPRGRGEGEADVQGPRTHTDQTDGKLTYTASGAVYGKKNAWNRLSRLPCPDSLEGISNHATHKGLCCRQQHSLHCVKQCRSLALVTLLMPEAPVRGLQATTRTHLHDWCRWQRGAATQALHASRHAAMKGRHVDGEERTGAAKGPGERQGQVRLVVVSIQGVPVERNPNAQSG